MYPVYSMTKPSASFAVIFPPMQTRENNAARALGQGLPPTSLESNGYKNWNSSLQVKTVARANPHLQLISGDQPFVSGFCPFGLTPRKKR